MGPDTPPLPPDQQARLDRIFKILDYAETLPPRNRDGSLAAPPPEEVAS